MAAHWWILRAVMAMEDRIVALILRQPGFHRAVGRVHRTIHERQYGRNPHEPLAPGEATVRLMWNLLTADPDSSARSQSFFRFFRDELRNQVQGKPTDLSKESAKNKK
ncbi:hypothetical protein ACO1O0_007655 [Amphichorda felina]